MRLGLHMSLPNHQTPCNPYDFPTPSAKKQMFKVFKTAFDRSVIYPSDLEKID